MSRKSWFKHKSYNNAKGYSFNDDKSNHGYYGFNLYFPSTDNLDVDKTLKNIEIFTQYIKRNIKNFCFKIIEKEKWFALNYKQLISDNCFLTDWKDFKTDVEKNTEHTLKCIGLAVHQYICTELANNILNESRLIDLETFKYLHVIHVRLINYDPVLQIKYLKVNYHGKLITVKGIAIKISNIKPQSQCIAFKCRSCSEVQVLNQADGIYTIPGRCPTSGCKAQSNFERLLSLPHTMSVNQQVLKLQEIPDEEQVEQGSVPQTIECELRNDLVDCCSPGDALTVTGVLKMRNTTENTNKYNKQQNCLYQLYIDIISVKNNKNQSEDACNNTFAQVTFDTTDYYAIQKIHAEPSLFRLLVHSLCPKIIGHEIVKAGLLLALFGGTSKEGVRAKSHVLVVGDPGLGKSQMLQACTNVAPKGVYVCSNSSSSSGLTVTMTKNVGGEYSLEAGALVLADQGCCCIDEFDKIPAQHACLLEAMEQQRISVAKAGVICSIPTHCTILAAANPVGGHYDKAKTVSENLKIASPMLSRFDLIFILLDQSNEELDVLLSEHILAAHTSSERSNSSTSATISSANTDEDNLREHLKLQPGECINYIPHPLLRKYIAYAHKYVNPELTEEAGEILKEFYFDVRQKFFTKYSSPLTPRLIASLVRLTQARAKVELREEATKQDAFDVINIMCNSLLEVFEDENGTLDTTRSQCGTGISSRNKISKFLFALQKVAEQETRSIFSTSELRDLCEDLGIPNEKSYNTINTLNIQGFLLSKGNGKYQLASVDF